MVRDALRRWVALALLLLSPGVAGQLLPLLHPCPAQHGVAGGAEMAGMAHGGGAHHHEAPASGEEHAVCTCLGACHAPALLVPPAVQIADIAVAARPAASGLLARTPFVVATRPLDRLPPQTAPPRI